MLGTIFASLFGISLILAGIGMFVLLLVLAVNQHNDRGITNTEIALIVAYMQFPMAMILVGLHTLLGL